MPGRTFPLAPAALLVLASLPACHHGSQTATGGATAPDAAATDAASTAAATLSGSVWVQQRGFMFTENPAVRATVTVAGNGMSGQATTDVSGEFRIAGLRTGDVTVTVSTAASPPGSVDEKVTLDEGDNTIRVVLPAAR